MTYHPPAYLPRKCEDGKWRAWLCDYRGEPLPSLTWRYEVEARDTYDEALQDCRALNPVES